MPQLILKCPYLKGSHGAARRGNYLRYIATREGVELTQGEGSLPGREGYLRYIAQRPHVQRVGRHGLFSASDKPISLSKAAEELSQHPGNVWTPILSLRREDAARLGYDHWEQWQALLCAHAPEVAEAMKIPFPDFRWYAAFHNEGYHPHVHMVCYSADPSKGYLTKEGLAQMRSVLARDIFRQDLSEIYKRQTRSREDLVQESQTALRDAIQKMREGPSQSSDLEPLLLQLAQKLRATSGKKQYGYLKSPVKKLVDEIVEELARDPAVSEAYRRWYALREEVLHTYRDDLPERIPLSEQKEFRQIKNLVIQEAVRLGDEAQTIPRLDSEDGAFQESEADAFFLPEAEPLWENDPSCIDPTPADLPWDDALPNIPKPYMEWNESYRRARCFLFGNENQHQDLDQAFQLFHAEAEKGNALAMCDLGRMLEDGLGCDPDPEASYKWYAKALASFRVVERQKPNRYAQYRIGKLYADGLGCEQDYSEAAKWFGASADSGYMYAYQYLYGQEEKAIPYAQRWAELDPEDEDAPAVIQACQEEIAKRAEAEAEDESDHTGVFTGFVLLSKAEWDKKQFIRDMKEKWDIVVDEYDASEEKDDDALVFEVGDMLAAVSLNNYPIPGGEAEGNAENNYMWEDAVKVAKKHRAHLMVAVLGKEEDLLEKGKLFTKVVAACCRQEYATGIYTSGVVFEPRFYEGFADMMQEDELPIFNWIWFGLWRDENGMNGYTYGLDVFGKDEMEVLDTDAKPSDLRDFLASLVSYVLENDVELHDGETIGFDADDKHTITRSPGVGLPEEQMTLKISWASSDGDPDNDNDGPDGEAPEDEESGVPEVYTEEEMEAVEGHIQQYFGDFEHVFHELASPDIHVDICVVQPSAERDYYTLVTMGMGAHRMNVPEELAEYKLERAELAIALPGNWKLKHEDLKNERWYWPIRLLKALARLPIASDTWLGFGHTMDNEEDFAKDTKLCAAILTGPQDTEDGSEVCILPSGEEVNFYQVIPLYRDELEYKLAHDADALLDKMNGISFVVEPDRQDAITRGTLSNDDFDGEMDDASYHIESIEEKGLPIDPINAYNHMAIYLRWCMEHDLMGEEFLKEYGEVAKQVKADPASVDLRAFIQNELDGCLFSVLFDQKGRAFAGYYYGEGDSPYYPADVDDNALRFFGPERYHSNEFQDEAYLFIPFDEDYYQAMAKVIEERFTNWQGQDFDEDTLEPSELAEALMEYLDCECTYFPSMKDDDPIMSAYSYAKRESVKEGFVPVLIKADDETLLECLVMNADPKNDADIYEFDLKTVTEYRKKMLSTSVKDGKAVLQELTGQRKEEAEDDDMDWEAEILGELEGGYENNRFSCYWDSDTDMTYPLILAKIPVKNPWEIFAYLPFGNWNDCPDTPQLMAAAKYWFEQHGAVPAAMSHDELEFLLPAPVHKETAMDVAVELYGFCPDVIDQGPEDATVGALADVLRQSAVWYLWWD